MRFSSLTTFPIEIENVILIKWSKILLFCDFIFDRVLTDRRNEIVVFNSLLLEYLEVNRRREIISNS